MAQATMNPFPGVDQRFQYGTARGTKRKGEAAESGKRYITGNEVTTILPRGNPTTFDWGNTFEFPIDDVPVNISRFNHLEMTFKFEKLKDGTQDWIACEANDVNYIHLAENFGSASIEHVGLRQGLDPLETDGFLPKCRYLYENTVLAFSDPSVRKCYAYNAQDPANYCFLDSATGGIQTDVYKSFMNKGEGLKDGMTMNVVPFQYPFQWRNRSTMHDCILPNTGNPLVLTVKLVSNFQQLFANRRYKYGSTDYISKAQYRIKVSDIRLILALPRFTAEGLAAIRNTSLPPLAFNSNHVIQYSQNVTAVNASEIHFNLTNVPLPHYMLLQIYDQLYFTGDPNTNYGKHIYKALPFAAKKTRITFGNRDISYNSANFDVQKPESAMLRRDIMKTSDVFESKLMDQSYFEDMKDFQHPHYLFSFCSDETNQTLLRPLDYTGPPNAPQNLAVSLLGSALNNAGFPEGKLIITLIYKRVGYAYNVKTGTFLERDLKSLVVA